MAGIVGPPAGAQPQPVPSFERTRAGVARQSPGRPDDTGSVDVPELPPFEGVVSAQQNGGRPSTDHPQSAQAVFR
jgi:hypothetical protein